jgi:hypothetical protein
LSTVAALREVHLDIADADVTLAVNAGVIEVTKGAIENREKGEDTRSTQMVARVNEAQERPISDLTLPELKAELDRYRVDYSGLYEKEALLWCLKKARLEAHKLSVREVAVKERQRALQREIIAHREADEQKKYGTRGRLIAVL